MKPWKKIRIRTCPNVRFAVPVRHALNAHEFWRLLVELTETQTRRRAGDLLKRLQWDCLPCRYGQNVFGSDSKARPRTPKSLLGAKRSTRYGGLLNSRCSIRRSGKRALNQGMPALG
jgi:hypothetical protein